MMDLERSLLEEFGTATFSEYEPEHRALGAVLEDDLSGVPDLDGLADYPGTADWRTSGIKRWANPIQLNQGRFGACTGFAACGLCNAAPFLHSYDNAYGFYLYGQNTTHDPFPGWFDAVNMVEHGGGGSTLRAAFETLKREKHITTYGITKSVSTLAEFVLNRGPACIAITWKTGMDRVDEQGYIHNTGSVRGGHMIVVDGVVKDVDYPPGEDPEPNRFRIRNSWGSLWGFSGRCRISFGDLQALLNGNGVAGTAVEVA